MMKSKPITMELVLQSVEISAAGCRLWTGYKIASGYGGIFRCVDGVRTFVLVHRFVYAHTKGTIPLGMNVCHSCDEPACCNPDHLFLGTDKDNSDDKISKLRHAYGSKHGLAKLTEADVLEIRKLAAQKVPLREIAKKFGVSHWTVGDAARGDSWKRVPIEKGNHANV